MTAIRHYRTGDSSHCADVFYSSIRTICQKDYTPQQINAWAPFPIDYEKWRRRCEFKRPFIAESDGVVAGFCELDTDGHIDCFYVHAGKQGRGIGSMLLDHVTSIGREFGLKRLYAEVSITAQPFFYKKNFEKVRDNLVMINSVELQNALLQLSLAS